MKIFLSVQFTYIIQKVPSSIILWGLYEYKQLVSCLYTYYIFLIFAQRRHVAAISDLLMPSALLRYWF